MRETLESRATVWSRVRGAMIGLGEAAATPAGTTPGRALPANASRKLG